MSQVGLTVGVYSYHLYYEKMYYFSLSPVQITCERDISVEAPSGSLFHGHLKMSGVVAEKWLLLLIR